MTRKHVLAIGGLDTACRAGILVDCETIKACGFSPLIVMGALTLQSENGVVGIQPVNLDLLRQQILIAVKSSLIGVKVGVFKTSGFADVLIKNINPDVPIVFDPVLFATRGGELIPIKVAINFIEDLGSRLFLMTPNCFEAAQMTGLPMPQTLIQVENIALKLLSIGMKAVLVKGKINGNKVYDVLATQDMIHVFCNNLINNELAGTGCRMSTYVASYLKELGFLTACQKAINYIHHLLTRHQNPEIFNNT